MSKKAIRYAPEFRRQMSDDRIHFCRVTTSTAETS